MRTGGNRASSKPFSMGRPGKKATRSPKAQKAIQATMRRRAGTREAAPLTHGRKPHQAHEATPRGMAPESPREEKKRLEEEPGIRAQEVGWWEEPGEDPHGSSPTTPTQAAPRAHSVSTLQAKIHI